MSKDLKEKAIDIKGNSYVLVSDRVIYFNETYKNGAIKTELVSDTVSDTYIIRATVIPDISVPERFFTGYSQAKIGDGLVNKTAALENAETSAVGRALAMMGIGVIDSIASVDEMKKAEVNTVSKPTNQGLQVYCEVCKTLMVHKTGTTKTGKPYDGWFCPTNKEHPPRWV